MPFPTPAFIQLVACHRLNGGTALYGLTAEGAVHQWCPVTTDDPMVGGEWKPVVNKDNPAMRRGSW